MKVHQYILLPVYPHHLLNSLFQWLISKWSPISAKRVPHPLQQSNQLFLHSHCQIKSQLIKQTEPSYHPKWVQNYPWLQYNNEIKKCDLICADRGRKNAFSTHRVFKIIFLLCFKVNNQVFCVSLHGWLYTQSWFLAIHLYIVVRPASLIAQRWVRPQTQ